jgi:hypothetical protein
MLTRTVAVVLAAAVVLLAAGWYFAGQIRAGVFEVHPSEVEQNLRVVAASADSVTLAQTGDRQGTLRTADTYGLAWKTGYGQVTGTPHAVGSTVTRDFVLVDGTLPAPDSGLRWTGTRSPRMTPSWPCPDTTSTRSHSRRPPVTSTPGSLLAPAGPGRSWCMGNAPPEPRCCDP